MHRAEPVNEFETPGGLRLLSDVLWPEELGWVDPCGGRHERRRARAIDEALRGCRVGGGENDRAGRAFRGGESRRCSTALQNGRRVMYTG